MRSARQSGVQLMWMLPASISRIPWIAPARSEVKMPAARPKAVPLAWAMAACQSLALLTATAGPNSSSWLNGAAALAAGEDAGPGLGGRGDRLLDPLRLRGGDQRAHVRVRRRRVAGLDRLDLGDQRVEEVVVDRRVG